MTLVLLLKNQATRPPTVPPRSITFAVPATLRITSDTPGTITITAG